MSDQTAVAEPEQTQTQTQPEWALHFYRCFSPWQAAQADGLWERYPAPQTVEITE